MTHSTPEIDARRARVRAVPVGIRLRTDLFTVQDLADEAKRIAATFKPILAETVVELAIPPWGMDETRIDYLRRVALELLRKNQSEWSA